MTDIVSRELALSMGLDRYFTGKPCRQGHISERYMSKSCVICQNKGKQPSFKKDMSSAKSSRLSGEKTYTARIPCMKCGSFQRHTNSSRCVKCRSDYGKKSEKLEYVRLWRIRNKDHSAKKKKIYYESNRDNILQEKKVYALINKDKIKQRTIMNREKYRARIRASNKKYKCGKTNQTPKWADIGKIKSIYEECERVNRETGIKHHVDHIVPLRGKTVSGLHVHNNLRIIPATENIRKKNKLIEDLIY